MRPLSFVLLMMALSAAVFAQKASDYPRTMYVSYDRAQIYDSSDYRSRILGEASLNDTVSVLGVESTYYRISYKGGVGYILRSNVGARPTAVGTQKKAKNETTGGSGTPVDTSHASAATGSARGAQVDRERPQCRALTKSGRQCSRRAADSSDYCWQHKKH